MTTSFFVTDLHGSISQYESLFHEIIKRKPSLVFIGGDLLPNAGKPLIISNEQVADFISDYLIPRFRNVKKQLGCNYPEVFIIMGNDDHRDNEEKLMEGESEKLWKYLNNSKTEFGSYTIYGYPFIPPTPFLDKDWDKFDVSRFVEPGSVPPTEGYRTVEPDYDAEKSTIQADLAMHLWRRLSSYFTPHLTILISTGPRSMLCLLTMRLWMFMSVASPFSVLSNKSNLILPCMDIFMSRRLLQVSGNNCSGVHFLFRQHTMVRNWRWWYSTLMILRRLSEN